MPNTETCTGIKVCLMYGKEADMADAEKRYPFSITKHGHNIEFAYNRLRNTVHAMENGEIPWDDKVVDRLEEVQELYDNCMCEPVYFATGKEYSLLQELSAWANDTRAATQALRRNKNG